MSQSGIIAESTSSGADIKRISAGGTQVSGNAAGVLTLVDAAPLTWAGDNTLKTITGTVAAATTTTLGVASFDSTYFTVTGGAVSLAGGIGMETFLTDSGAPAVQPDSITGEVNLLSAPSTGITVTGQGPGNTVTISGVDATNTGTKGVASYDPYDFVVSGGNVALRAGLKIYIVGKWGNDAADGLTFESAKRTIQAAVAAADASGGNATVLVHPGTYIETITHTADNVCVFAIGDPNNCIIQQTDANVIDFNTRVGIIYKFFKIQVTAATTAINTLQGTTGTIEFKDCYLGMSSTTAIVAATQPAVASITGAGIIYVTLGNVDYLHTGACGATALKSAFIVGTGGLITLRSNTLATISCSGSALATSLAIDLATTGNIQLYTSTIEVTDPDATIVSGLGYLLGTGTAHEYFKNTIHVTVGAANAGYGFYAGDSASTSRFYYNHIHVTDAGGTSNSYFVGAGATVVAQFDDIIAADGPDINATGTFTQVISQVNGVINVNQLEVETLTSTYANSEWVFRQAAVQTADAVATEIASIALAANTMCLVKGTIQGFKSDYSESIGADFLYTCRRAAGAAIEVAAPHINTQHDSGGAPTIDCDVNVNDCRILVQGPGAVTYNWVCNYSYSFVQTSA